MPVQHFDLIIPRDMTMVGVERFDKTKLQVADQPKQSLAKSKDMTLVKIYSIQNEKNIWRNQFDKNKYGLGKQIVIRWKSAMVDICVPQVGVERFNKDNLRKVKSIFQSKLSKPILKVTSCIVEYHSISS